MENENKVNTINISLDEYKNMVKEIETLKAKQSVEPIETIKQSSLGEEVKEVVKPKKKGIFWNE